MRERGEALEVLVADDGCGGADASKGTGLHGLEERLRVLDGTLKIESKSGKGTRLLAHIPLPTGEEEQPGDDANQE